MDQKLSAHYDDDCRFEIAQNIFADNRVFNVERNALTEGLCRAAALALQSGSTLTAIQGNVLGNMFAAIERQLPGYCIWLLISNGGVIRDSRIARYFGLWGGLKRAHLQLPSGEKSEEYIKETEDGIQFFAGLRMSEPHGPDVAVLLSEKRPMYVLASPTDDGVHKILSAGWGFDSRRFPSAILSALDTSQLLLISPLGEFDDREGGAVAIGNLGMIQSAFAGCLSQPMK